MAGPAPPERRAATRCHLVDATGLGYLQAWPALAVGVVVHDLSSSTSIPGSPRQRVRGATSAPAPR